MSFWEIVGIVAVGLLVLAIFVVMAVLTLVDGDRDQ